MNTDVNYYFQPIELVDHTKLTISENSVYSSTPWREANFISRTILNFFGEDKKLTPQYGSDPIITDATANIGCNTISFYLSGFKRVNAVEIDSNTHSMLKSNIETYNLPTNSIYCCNYLDVYDKLQQDVVFIDSPWGGPDYIKFPCLDLFLSGTNIVDICFDIIYKNLASLLVLKLPINYNLKDLVSRLQTRTFLMEKIYRGQKQIGRASCRERV
mgnify:CR=1 FL=1